MIEAEEPSMAESTSHRLTHFFLGLALLTGSWLTSVASGQTTPPPSPAVESNAAEPAKRISRIATIGASASAGYGVYFTRQDDPGASPSGMSLAKLLRIASGEQVVTIDLGTAAFFSNPTGIGTRLVNRAIQSKPDLTLAIDYLFWFTFGSVGVESARIRTVEDRLALLEVGLAQLDRITGPILVGDIPDMSSAEGRMLRKSQIPSSEAQQRANDRIRAWVAARPNARFFPLRELIEQLRRGASFDIAGQTWTVADAKTLILPDRLHPSLDGLIALVAAIDEILAADTALAAIRPTLEVDRRRLRTRVTGTKSTEPEIANEPAVTE